jgi:hypothetical protein
LKGLGKLIRKKTEHGRDPYFTVIERGCRSPVKDYKLDSDFIYNMTRGKFTMRQPQSRNNNKLSETEIRFFPDSRHTYPIGGFPRCLMDDEKSQASRGSMKGTT